MRLVGKFTNGLTTLTRRNLNHNLMPSCKHGDMKFLEGVSSKTGKPWKGYFCPSPKGTPDQCSPQFVKDTVNSTSGDSASFKADSLTEISDTLKSIAMSLKVLSGRKDAGADEEHRVEDIRF